MDLIDQVEFCVISLKIISTRLVVRPGTQIHVAGILVNTEPHHAGVRLNLHFFDRSCHQIILGEVLVARVSRAGIKQAPLGIHGNANSRTIQFHPAHPEPIGSIINVDCIGGVRHVEQVVDFVQSDPVGRRAKKYDGRIRRM